jgi:putative endonuclease
VKRSAIQRRLLFYYRQSLGWFGELIALFYYWRFWHYIVIRNWRCPIGEIDLITIQNRTLHLVEVKTRIRKAGVFSAISQMTETKRKKLQDLSAYYWNFAAVDIRRKRITRIQIDFFGIDISWKRLFPRFTITHIPRLISTYSKQATHYEEIPLQYTKNDRRLF